jgi:hypothetical protein
MYYLRHQLSIASYQHVELHLSFTYGDSLKFHVPQPQPPAVVVRRSMVMNGPIGCGFYK